MKQIKRGWKMTRREQEDQAQLEWLRKWKERRKEKRDVRKKSLFYKILRNYKGLRGRHKNKNGDVQKSNKGKCMS